MQSAKSTISTESTSQKIITIEVLIGMIASGKSTYSLLQAREGSLIISHDDLTQMLHGEYRYEQELRDLYRGMEEGLVLTAFRYGKSVVIDHNHLTRESRKRWIVFAQENRSWVESLGYSLHIKAVLFPVESIDVHLERRMKNPRGRSREEWEKVLHHHYYDQWSKETLTVREMFDEIQYLTQGGVEKMVCLLEGKTE